MWRGVSWCVFLCLILQQTAAARWMVWQWHVHSSDGGWQFQRQAPSGDTLKPDRPQRAHSRGDRRGRSRLNVPNGRDQTGGSDHQSGQRRSIQELDKNFERRDGLNHEVKPWRRLMDGTKRASSRGRVTRGKEPGIGGDNSSASKAKQNKPSFQRQGRLSNAGPRGGITPSFISQLLGTSELEAAAALHRAFWRSPTKTQQRPNEGPHPRGNGASGHGCRRRGTQRKLGERKNSEANGRLGGLGGESSNGTHTQNRKCSIEIMHPNTAPHQFQGKTYWR